MREAMISKEEPGTSGDVDAVRRLANVAVGGLHLEMIGLSWLLAATIATSMPDGAAHTKLC